VVFGADCGAGACAADGCGGFQGLAGGVAAEPVKVSGCAGVVVEWGGGAGGEP
jgi:hypothetical protein